MKESDAMDLVSLLNAAWPREALEAESVKVYVDALAAFQSMTAARQAVVTIMAEAIRFPSIAELTESYRACRRLELEAFAQSRGLAEPPGAPPPKEWYDLGERLGVDLSGLLKEV